MQAAGLRQPLVVFYEKAATQCGAPGDMREDTFVVG
jgi:hypothetical protein